MDKYDYSRKACSNSRRSVDDEDEFVGGLSSDYFTTPESTVLFYACKYETFNLKNNYRQFYRKVKQVFGFGIIELKEELGDGLLQFCKLVVIAGIQTPLTGKEMQLLKEYFMMGGSILIMAEGNCKPELYNEFLAPFGIALVKDTVISVKRVVPYLPKQCFVQNIVSAPSLLPTDNDSTAPINFNIIYPYGCTLNLSKNAIPFASSGTFALPHQRPVGAIHVEPLSKGKLVVLGSGLIFADGYMEKEDNSKFFEFVMDLVCKPGELEMAKSEATDSEVIFHSEPVHAIGVKSNSQRGLLLDTNDHLFPGTVNAFGQVEPRCGVDPCTNDKIGPNMTPREACKLLKLPFGDLSIRGIKPTFEAPLPPVKLAAHPPFFSDVGSPALELFDLDEEFSKPEQKLARLTQKCTEDDMAYYVESMGNILNIKVPESGSGEENGQEAGNEVDDPERKAKEILHHMLTTLVAFKCCKTSEGNGDDDSPNDYEGESQSD